MHMINWLPYTYQQSILWLVHVVVEKKKKGNDYMFTSFLPMRSVMVFHPSWTKGILMATVLCDHHFCWSRPLAGAASRSRRSCTWFEDLWSTHDHMIWFEFWSHDRSCARYWNRADHYERLDRAFDSSCPTVNRFAFQLAVVYFVAVPEVFLCSWALNFKHRRCPSWLAFCCASEVVMCYSMTRRLVLTDELTLPSSLAKWRRFLRGRRQHGAISFAESSESKGPGMRTNEQTDQVELLFVWTRVVAWMESPGSCGGNQPNQTKNWRANQRDRGWWTVWVCLVSKLRKPVVLAIVWLQWWKEKSRWTSKTFDEHAHSLHGLYTILDDDEKNKTKYTYLDT